MKRKQNRVKNDVAIIGGGASGITAAIFAARAGKKTVILEKNPRIGKKILSTGNGRCNFTNANVTSDRYNSDFAEYALKRFSSKDTVTFFKELGLLPREEAEGRIYPLVGQASALLDVLRLELARLGVECLCDFDVCRIEKQNGGFGIFDKSGRVVGAKKLIVSTGGMAAPKTGSDGSGYKLLEKLGHTKTSLVPALTQIKTGRGIRGVRAQGKITLENGMSATGEIQFTENGISGIPTFSLAKYAKKGMKISLDMLPDMSRDEVFCMLRSRPVQSMETFLIGVLNKALAQVILKECGISSLSKMSDTLRKSDFEMIADKIKNRVLEAEEPMPWDSAQVTAGGIQLAEVNQKTMESYLVPGLYITGELLDIDGDCGGFNLQWAWASGALAGSEAANV